MNMRSFLLLILTLVLMPRSAFADPPSYETDVRPILTQRCGHCHGGQSPKNGLDLTTREGLVRGGKTGAAMQPGSLRESLIWTFIATDKMPADDQKLSAQQKDTLRRWILAGAPANDEEAAKIEADQPKARPSIAQTTIGVAAMADRIDMRIDARLQQAAITAAPTADDARFLRRVYLDLNGRVPSHDETVQFLADGDPGKRARLIDRRLASPEFGQHMAIHWHKLLIPKSAGAYPRIPHDKFRGWLADSFNSDRGWDAIVTDLITAEGYLPSDKDNEIALKKDAKLQPRSVATAFINAHNTEGRPQPKGIVASVSRLFLAQSIECAQCHNHPQAKWKQEDFWAAAAFFERVRYEKAVYGDTIFGRLVEPSEGKDLVYEDTAKGRYAFVQAVYDSPVIDMQDADGQLTGRMIRAKFLDGPEPDLDPQRSYRAEFARWATDRANPFFAPAMVNRVWSQLLGRGFVEPVDDMSEDNRPSHPELLTELSSEFATSGFDVKHLMRCICNSRTYQRSSVLPSAEDSPAYARLFARQLLKQMTEEQLLASLATVVPTFAAMLEEDARDKNPGLTKKAFLEIHETDVDNSTEHTRGLQQALRMMNGDGKLFNREALKNRISADNSVEENLTNVYLQALNRHPTPQELKDMTQFVSAATAEIGQLDEKKLPQLRNDQPDSTPDPYSDILWVLINSGEFIFNH
jgi:hypothetical protein